MGAAMTEPLSDLIIGSGPTGYAAALALVSAGEPAVLMDFGDELDLVRPPLRSIASKPDPRSARALTYPRSLVSTPGEIPLPLSSARGGLSLIWGAAVLERSAADCPELEPVFPGIEDGYALLRERVHLAGDEDRLGERFPWPDRTPSVPSSARFARIRHASLGLTTRDVLVGCPRVAVRAEGCTRCGLCLAGCPEELFFDAHRSLIDLEAVGDVRFVQGPALALRQAGDHVEVSTPAGPVRARRVHLAAGPIGTPALLQRSGLVPESLEVQDSAVFYVPIINRNRAAGDEHDYTAAQLLVAARSRGDDDFTLAVYESNPDFRERLARVLRVPERLVPFPGWLSARVNAGIGFLGPERSGALTLHFDGERTWVEPRSPDGIRRSASEAARRAGRGLRELGLHPIATSVMVPAPGVGFHSGGALPLGGEHLDWDGSLRAVPAVRIVDATALPRIWAGSHTYTAMANAVRTIRVSR